MRGAPVGKLTYVKPNIPFVVSLSLIDVEGSE
jgi:hypothetical protein